MTDKNWFVHEIRDTDNVLSHMEIVPENDTDDHVWDFSCGCSPRDEYHRGVLIRVHQAFDGRHTMEGMN